MPSGGARAGAGRPIGAKTGSAARRALDNTFDYSRPSRSPIRERPIIKRRADILAAGGKDALTILQEFYMDPELPRPLRADCAKACLPYESSRLPLEARISETQEVTVKIIQFGDRMPPGKGPIIEANTGILKSIPVPASNGKAITNKIIQDAIVEEMIGDNDDDDVVDVTPGLATK